MTTLISAKYPGGTYRRCDSRCHHATGPYRDCICGGVNHGVGHEQAVINTREHAQEWIDRYQAEHPDVVSIRINEIVLYQEKLPGL
jgi:hypothetical protein